MRYDFLLQSLQHAQNTILGKNRLKGFKRKIVASRIDTDGLLQTKYKLVSKTRNELFTKFTVNVLYDKEDDQEFKEPNFKHPIAYPPYTYAFGGYTPLASYNSLHSLDLLHMQHSNHPIHATPFRSIFGPYDFPNAYMLG